MAFKEILALFALRDHEMSTDHLSPHDALSRGQSNEAKGSWTSISKTTRQTKTTNTKKLTFQLKKSTLFTCMCMYLSAWIYVYQVYAGVQGSKKRVSDIPECEPSALTKSVSSPGALSAHNN